MQPSQCTQLSGLLFPQLYNIGLKKNGLKNLSGVSGSLPPALSTPVWTREGSLQGGQSRFDLFYLFIYLFFFILRERERDSRGDAERERGRENP